MKANNETTLYILILILIVTNGYFIYLTISKDSNEQFFNAPGGGRTIPIPPPSPVAEAGRAAKGVLKQNPKLLTDMKSLLRDPEIKPIMRSLLLSVLN